MTEAMAADDTSSDAGGGDKASKNPEYKITISVEVNGRTIAQHSQKLPPAPYLHVDRSPLEPAPQPPAFFRQDRISEEEDQML